MRGGFLIGDEMEKKTRVWIDSSMPEWQTFAKALEDTGNEIIVVGDDNKVKTVTDDFGSHHGDKGRICLVDMDFSGLEERVIAKPGLELGRLYNVEFDAEGKPEWHLNKKPRKKAQWKTEVNRKR